MSCQADETPGFPIESLTAELMPTRISAATFDFLRDLRANNNRDWFQENRHRYDASHQEMIEFAEALFDRVSETDLLEPESGKKILYRIYRDVRFSKNKAPYKTHWAGSFRRATAERRGGLYFHVAPDGRSFVGGGFWKPEKEDLLRIRQEIAADDEPMREIMADSRFRQYFGSLGGEQLKTAPRGFDKQHPAIDLLRHKQFWSVVLSVMSRYWRIAFWKKSP
jgi:uncharacterized protein (TIGR02453 family)